MSDYFNTEGRVDQNDPSATATVRGTQAPRSAKQVTPLAKERVLLSAIGRLTEICGQPLERAGEWQFSCPSHDDENPSLSVGHGDNGVLIHCHAGCATNNVIDVAGLTWQDLYYAPKGKKETARTEVRRDRYTYTDEKGELAGVNARITYSDGSKQFQWSGDPMRPEFIYKRESVPSAIEENRLVWVVEGEKAVDALRQRGEVAVSLHGGAGSAQNKAKRQALVDLLSGARVALCRDGDYAGKVWEEDLRAALKPVTCSLAVINHGWIKGYDITDWLEAHPKRSPRSLPSSAPLFRSENEKESKLSEIIWVWQDRIPANHITLEAGNPENGKSTTLSWIASELTQGTLEGDYLGTPRNVLMIAREEDDATIRAKMAAHGADMNRVYVFAIDEDIPQFSESGWWSEAMRSIDPVLVVIDPLTVMMGGKSQISDAEQREAFAWITDAVINSHNEAGRGVVGVKHLLKASRSSSADFDPTALISGNLAGGVGTARSVLMVFTDEEEGTTHVTLEKANLTNKKNVKVLVGHITEAKGLGRTTAKFVPDATLQGRTWNEQMQKVNKTKESGDEDLGRVAEWVKRRLAKQHWIRSSDVDDFIIEQGINDVDAFRRRVKNRISTTTARCNGVGTGWLWFDETLTKEQAKAAEHEDRSAGDVVVEEDPHK